MPRVVSSLLSTKVTVESVQLHKTAVRTMPAAPAPADIDAMWNKMESVDSNLQRTDKTQLQLKGRAVHSSQQRAMIYWVVLLLDDQGQCAACTLSGFTSLPDRRSLSAVSFVAP
eukprot:scpid70239/ scgid17616/ 